MYAMPPGPSEVFLYPVSCLCVCVCVCSIHLLYTMYVQCLPSGCFWLLPILLSFTVTGKLPSLAFSESYRHMPRPPPTRMEGEHIMLPIDDVITRCYRQPVTPVLTCTG